MAILLFASYDSNCSNALLQARKDRGGARNAFNLTSITIKMTKFLRKKGHMKSRKDPPRTEEGGDNEEAISSRRKEGAIIGISSGFDATDCNQSHVALGPVIRNGRRPLPDISPDRQKTVASIGSCGTNVAERHGGDDEGVHTARRWKVANHDNSGDRTENDYLQVSRRDGYANGEVILHRTVQ